MLEMLVWGREVLKGPGKWLSQGCRGDGAVPGDGTPPGSNAPPAKNLGESQRSTQPAQTHEERGDEDTRGRHSPAGAAACELCWSLTPNGPAFVLQA